MKKPNRIRIAEMQILELLGACPECFSTIGYHFNYAILKDDWFMEFECRHCHAIFNYPLNQMEQLIDIYIQSHPEEFEVDADKT
jgi:hypothetical protein